VHIGADLGRGDGLRIRRIVHVDAHLNVLCDVHVQIGAPRALRGGLADAPRIARGDHADVLHVPRVAYRDHG